MRTIIKKQHYILTSYAVLCLLPLLLSCHRETALERALVLAGDNRAELETVLRHYQNDSLKREAARFLIENMPYHFYSDEYYLSPRGEKYRPQLANFLTSEDATATLDSLKWQGYTLERRKCKDIQNVNSTYLIQNIELAFEVWRKPWAHRVPFPVFCRYILPYRISTEYPSESRKTMMDRFLPLLDSAGVVSPLEACSLVNERLRKVMKYKKNTYPLYPTIDDTYAWGGGQCEGICDLGLFVMRAVGIPVAMEQTVWTRMDWGHRWGALWHEGRFYGFAPGEQPPGTYPQTLNKGEKLRPAKVYRSHFAFPPNHESEKEDDGYVCWLKSPLLEDVTTEYLDAPIDIRVTTDRVHNFPHVSGQAYLCAYNYYQWTPIALGCRTDTVCRFHRVGGNNIFIVADAPSSGQLRFLTTPFYVDMHGNIRKFTPHPERPQTFTLPKRKRLLNRPYTLHYWNPETDSFSSLDYACTMDSSQTYTNIPENALLWFTVPDRIVNQRVFFIENDSVITMDLIR